MQSVLDIPRTRTSYALSTMAPSALEPEVQNSHFHDMELCQLLHALDQPMGEPVKKAVRKAVRARVKKLGMKYDNEVRFHSRCLYARRRSNRVHSPSRRIASPSMTTTRQCTSSPRSPVRAPGGPKLGAVDSGGS